MTCIGRKVLHPFRSQRARTVEPIRTATRTALLRSRWSLKLASSTTRSAPQAGQLCSISPPPPRMPGRRAALGSAVSILLRPHTAVTRRFHVMYDRYRMKKRCNRRAGRRQPSPRAASGDYSSGTAPTQLELALTPSFRETYTLPQKKPHRPHAEPPSPARPPAITSYLPATCGMRRWLSRGVIRHQHRTGSGAKDSTAPGRLMSVCSPLRWKSLRARYVWQHDKPLRSS